MKPAAKLLLLAAATLLCAGAALAKLPALSDEAKAKAAEVLSHLSPEEQAEYLKTLPPWRLREILEELSLDDLADALQAVRKEDPAYFQRLKDLLDPRTRAEVEALARYEEDEAGGLMTPEYVAVREGMTVEEVLRFLRRAAPDAETIYYIYVVDEKGRLKGVLSLRDLIVADPGRGWRRS